MALLIGSFGKDNSDHPPGKLIEWLMRYKDSDNVQFCLGNCYRWGLGIEQDGNKAAKWYGLAASKGHAFAQFYLGVCYLNGLGVQRDLSAVVLLYTLAVEQGNSFSQFGLG